MSADLTISARVEPRCEGFYIGQRETSLYSTFNAIPTTMLSGIQLLIMLSLLMLHSVEVHAADPLCTEPGYKLVSSLK